jgi:biotin operon repressor
MSTWQGISHTRLTRSTESLPPAAYKVLGVLRRVIPDGQRRKMSQADIARRAKISRSTVAEAMRSLDGIYLARHYLGLGRGKGYEIEMLPLPELRKDGRP